MNLSLREALNNLRLGQFEQLRAEMNVMLGGRGVHETTTQYLTRFLRKIESEGRVRELEQELLRFI